MAFENHPAMVCYREMYDKFDKINEAIEQGGSTVAKFYEDSVIFITGASGFIGKQTVEKLFRSCKIKKLYYVLRPRRNKTVEQRLQDVLKDPIYDYLHKTQPNFTERIVPVKGDITQLKVGIEEDTWNRIADEVDVIFHGAATVNFTEPLNVAVLTNVRGTREVLTLAKHCKKLRSFVYLSTAFVHVTVPRFGEPTLEQFYDVPIDPDFLIALAENMNQDILDEITPKIIKGWPNTYTFTKATAEELLKKNSGELPVSILRPSIVVNGYKELPGWCDKSAMDSGIGFILGACLGVLHVMYADKDKSINMIPVDLVNNATLLVARETVQRRERGEKNIKIYTVSNERTPFTVEFIHNFCTEKARAIPSPKILWYGYLIITKSDFMFTLLTWLLHYIPGYMADGILRLCGRKPIAMKLLKKAFKQSKIYRYFSVYPTIFEDTNTMEMFKKLTPTDQLIFDCDVGNLDKEKYFYILALGVRKYLLKDELKDTDYALKKQKMLFLANCIFLSLYAYGIWKLFCTLLNLAILIMSVLF